jgi:hypothetical protein
VKLSRRVFLTVELEKAHLLASTMRIMGQRWTAAKFRPSCHAPVEDAPSPEKTMPTRCSSRRLKDSVMPAP